METYRLNSRVVENNKEYVIQTTNDVGLGSVSSDVFVDGTLAESIRMPHPEHVKPEEILALVQTTHNEKKKELETLLGAYRKALQSGNAEVLYHLGLAFYYKRFFAEAKELLNAAIGLHRDYHEAYNLLGQAELALGNPDLAVAAAESAVSRKPGFADYHNNLGEALLSAKNTKGAQQEFEKAIGINLYYSDAYFNYGLALILEALENARAEVRPNLVAKAVDYLNKASLTYSDYKTAQFERGLEALKIQDLRLAFNLLRKVRENKKAAHGRRYAPYHMKYAVHPQWITEKAVLDRIKFLEGEIARNPGYVDLYAELSRCYLEVARIMWKKGIDSYNKTLSINPSIKKLAAHIDAAEDVYQSITGAIDEINRQE